MAAQPEPTTEQMKQALAAGVPEIERLLAIRLPENYRQVLHDYPFDYDSVPYRWELWGHAERIIDATMMCRVDGFFGGAWPHHFVVIGENGLGDLYLLDTSRADSPVFEAQHETTARANRLIFAEVAPNIKEWVTQLQRDEEAIEADKQAQAERKQKKRWWQFWI